MRILSSVALLALFPLAAVAQDKPGSTPLSDANDQSYTLRTQSNVVLVPTTVQTKKGEMIYGLKATQFVVEDNGVAQKINLDEDTDVLGLSLVVVVQCSRLAGWELTNLGGLGTMIDQVAGGAPREVAVVTYESAPLLLGKFSSSPEAMSRALSQLTPCDGPGAATFDAVRYATKLLAAKNDHNRHAILLISETRDQGSEAKPAEVVAELGRTNTVVDAVAFGAGRAEIIDDLKHGGGSGPIGLLVMAVEALRKNVAHELAALSGGEYINFTSQKGFDAGLQQLSNHIHNYYLLSFQPQASANGVPSPGMHRIRVHVPDYPEAKMRFRESYFSGELDTSAPVN